MFSVSLICSEITQIVCISPVEATVQDRMDVQGVGAETGVSQQAKWVSFAFERVEYSLVLHTSFVCIFLSICPLTNLRD